MADIEDAASEALLVPQAMGDVDRVRIGVTPRVLDLGMEPFKFADVDTVDNCGRLSTSSFAMFSVSRSLRFL